MMIIVSTVTKNENEINSIFNNLPLLYLNQLKVTPNCLIYSWFQLEHVEFHH